MARTIGRMSVFYADSGVSIADSGQRMEFHDQSQEMKRLFCSRKILYGSIAMPNREDHIRHVRTDGSKEVDGAVSGSGRLAYI